MEPGVDLHLVDPDLLVDNGVLVPHLFKGQEVLVVVHGGTVIVPEALNYLDAKIPVRLIIAKLQPVVAGNVHQRRMGESLVSIARVHCGKEGGITGTETQDRTTAGSEGGTESWRWGVLEVELEPESGVEAVFVQNRIEPAWSFSRDISQAQPARRAG